MRYWDFYNTLCRLGRLEYCKQKKNLKIFAFYSRCITWEFFILNLIFFIAMPTPFTRSLSLSLYFSLRLFHSFFHFFGMSVKSILNEIVISFMNRQNFLFGAFVFHPFSTRFLVSLKGNLKEHTYTYWATSWVTIVFV